MAVLAVAALLAPAPASAQNFLEALFGGGPSRPDSQPSPIARFFADPFGLNNGAAPPPAPRSIGGSGPAFCVRSCDGKYFPLQSRAGMTPVQLCQAFCPASATRVFMGSSIDSAATATGERYAQSENAFAFRTALKPDCTCNGRDPAGLAPIDLSMDTSLRPGDVVATTSGLVAYTGTKAGGGAEFTPVASYPGLTPGVRARLGEMKVAPVTAEMAIGNAPMPETLAESRAEVRHDIMPAQPKARATARRAKDRRAGLD